jgi:rhodanese-related sulfurtransferase
MRTIYVEDVKKRMDEGESLNLLDVREDHERTEFNIGGTHYRLRRLQEMDIEEIEHLKNEEVICYCKSGQRSAMACLILEHLGFTNTANMAGGVTEWKEKFPQQ